MKLSESQRWMIIQALHIAAAQYAMDGHHAAVSAYVGGTIDARLAAQFFKQHDDTRALADAIEEADEVTL